MLLLPVLTGFLLVLAFPRSGQFYLAWIAFIPLIYFLCRVKSPARAFWGGLLCGAIEHFALLLWMPAVLQDYGGLHGGLAWTGFLFAVLLLACLPAIACFAAKGLMLRGGDSFLLSGSWWNTH